MEDNKTNKKLKTVKMTTLAILISLVVIFSLLANSIHFGPVPVTLALCPIIVGAAIFGPVTGALLGFTFGLITLLTGLANMDGGVVLTMASVNLPALIFVCIFKGVAAGFVAGLVYKKLGIIGASVACPVVNTGIFIAAMLLWFKDMLAQWSGGTNLLSYIIISLTGMNFLFELGINLIIASAVERIIKYEIKKFS